MYEENLQLNEEINNPILKWTTENKNGQLCLKWHNEHGEKATNRMGENLANHVVWFKVNIQNM